MIFLQNFTSNVHEVQLHDSYLDMLGIVGILIRIVLPLLFVIILIVLLIRFFKMMKEMNNTLKRIEKHSESINLALQRKEQAEKERRLNN